MLLNNSQKYKDLLIESLCSDKLRLLRGRDIKSPEDLMLSFKSKELLNKADIAYKTIAPKMMGSIKTHLNHRAADYNDKVTNDLGLLKFVKPTLYLKHISNKDSVAQMISPSDDALAYSFLMFRAISGINARKLEPSFQVSFQKNAEKSYDANDILDSFLYKKNNLEVLGHNTDGSPNSDALNILKNDKAEVADIVKNVFKKYIYACNNLKNSEEIYQVTVCNSYTDYSSPDYFTDMLTCLEIFNIAALPEFCKEKPDYQHIDL